ncbi:hypothetical protein FA15DRAFT_95264 [Coprinopsis marcescibilis]|uniref:DUF6593 domain-containing protein n=1 Tax=Coprinopsis marcescibilis TaxID=230819 RepID=A0A5C3KLU0_COPMA|nr:hypothetical protein FA15DRAFT_95264 [Coprinopsis marcescibilis]
MSGDNPFAQWYSEQNPISASIYGALPLGQSTPVPYNLLSGSTSPNVTAVGNAQLQIMSFQFMSAMKTILNSTVMGANGKKYFTIATHAVGNTIIINDQAGNGTGEAAGTIEWQQRPYVALLDMVARQAASQWLTLSADKRYRTMMVRGQQYSWVPSAGMICLYTAGNNPSEFVARISKGRDAASGAMLSLDVTTKAVQGGLLDACILAALLFNSGRNFD